MVDIMHNKMLTVSIDKEFNAINKDYSDTIYLRLYSSLFESGIVRDLKPTQFTILLAIASYMDSDGNCYPTQRQVSDVVGVTLPTVNRAINELLNYSINGVPLITRKLIRTGKYENSYYTINSGTPITISGNSEKYDEDLLKEIERNVVSKDKDRDSNKDIKCKDFKQETKKFKQEDNTPSEITNTKHVIDYFCKKYREVYNESYTSNFGRDAGQINNALIGKFSSDQLKTMIDYSITEYDARWKKDAFRRPTIVAICTWLGREALALANDKQKEAERVGSVAKESTKVNSNALEKFGVALDE